MEVRNALEAAHALRAFLHLPPFGEITIRVIEDSIDVIRAGYTLHPEALARMDRPEPPNSA